MPAVNYSVDVYERPGSPFWWACAYFAGQGGRKVRWSTGVRVDGEGGKKVTRRAGKRAADREAEHRAAVLGDEKAASEDTSLTAVAARLIRQKHADGRRQRAVDSLAWVIDKYVAPFFGETRDVRTIRRADLEAFKADLRGKLDGPTSINNALTGIRQILKHAFHVDELLEAVPEVANVRVPPESKGRALTPEQVDALIGSVDPRAREAREWLTFIANTGLRKSEALAIEWSWVDWERRCIRIPAEYRKGGRAQLAPTQLNDVTFALLEDRRKRRKQPRLGRVWFQQKHDEARNSAAKRAGLGRVRNHDLRHTLGSLLHASGASAPEVRDALGHSTLAMVNRYAHSYHDRLREVANRVQLGSVPGTVPGERVGLGGKSSNSARSGGDGKPGKPAK